MKVTLKNTEFLAFQFQRHVFEELPDWARSYTVRHGAEKARLYRHSIQSKVFVPFVGGFMPVNPTEWMVHDGERILVVPDSEFKRRYKTLSDDADAQS